MGSRGRLLQRQQRPRLRGHAEWQQLDFHRSEPGPVRRGGARPERRGRLQGGLFQQRTGCRGVLHQPQGACATPAGTDSTADQLNFQVFTTKDGTANTPVGPGDIGGRNDIRDTIYDDLLAEDYWKDQSYISQAQNAVLRGWVGRNADNDRGRRTKVISAVVHGNQAIQPGSTTPGPDQHGRRRLLPSCSTSTRLYASPVAPARHADTRLVASSGRRPTRIRLAPRSATDPRSTAGSAQLCAGRGHRSAGQHLRRSHRRLFPAGLQHGRTCTLRERVPRTSTADTHSSARFLDTRAGRSTPNTLSQIDALGFDHTFIDQMRHVRKWFGRNSALGDDGYRINQVNGVKCFVINDQASTYRFQNTDNGVALSLRDLLHRKARSGTQDQVIVLFSNWEDFANKANADAYDRNIRWIAQPSMAATRHPGSDRRGPGRSFTTTGWRGRRLGQRGPRNKPRPGKGHARFHRPRDRRKITTIGITASPVGKRDCGTSVSTSVPACNWRRARNSARSASAPASSARHGRRCPP